MHIPTYCDSRLLAEACFSCRNVNRSSIFTLTAASTTRYILVYTCPSWTDKTPEQVVMWVIISLFTYILTWTCAVKSFSFQIRPEYGCRRATCRPQGIFWLNLLQPNLSQQLNLITAPPQEPRGRLYALTSRSRASSGKCLVDNGALLRRSIFCYSFVFSWTTDDPHRSWRLVILATDIKAHTPTKVGIL